MGLVRDGIGGKEGPWSWVLPAAFAQGGAVDMDLAAGVTFGEEVGGILLFSLFTLETGSETTHDPTALDITRHDCLYY